MRNDSPELLDRLDAEFDEFASRILHFVGYKEREIHHTLEADRTGSKLIGLLSIFDTLCDDTK